MATDDALVEEYFKRFTYLLDAEIADLTSVSGEALRESKRVLALEATAMAHGIEAAQQAEDATKRLFAAGASGPDASDESLPTTTIAVTDLTDEFTLADAFIAAELAKSRGEARRLANQGGLRVNDEQVKDVDVSFTGVLGDATAVLLRAGKKRFKRIAIL